MTRRVDDVNRPSTPTSRILLTAYRVLPSRTDAGVTIWTLTRPSERQPMSDLFSIEGKTALVTGGSAASG